MNESPNIPAPENYRNEKAEEIIEMRKLGQKLDAKNFLGDLRLEPEYLEKRKVHKNILAKASNEKMAEEAISNTEAQAIITFKKINIEVAKMLSGRESTLERQSVEIESAKKLLRDAKLLESMKNEVKNKEERGIDRGTILNSIKEDAEKIASENERLSKNWNDLNADDNITDVTNISSAISSWFDSVRDMLQDWKLNSIDRELSEKSAQYICYESVLEETEKDQNLLVSISIERVIKKINDYIKSELDLDSAE